LRAALSFLTRIPVGRLEYEDFWARLGKEAGLFPLVGAIVGAAGLLAARLTGLLWGPPVSALAVVLVSVWLTNAFHLDGLMDSADGLLSHRSRERMLEIMKDSRVGAMGAIAGALDLLARFALVLALPEAWRVPALITAPMLGRMAIPLVARLFPKAGSGLGAGWAASVGPVQIGTALLIGIGGSVGLGAFWGPALAGALRGLAVSIVVVLVTTGLARRWSGVLGGLTGDIYGALAEIGEITALLVWAIRGVGL
jgi:cobalamin 5'-phosphate synthase/cobalamin synthase